MASRRLPLANVPNAVNSPLRPTTANAVPSQNGKRTRAQSGDLREVVHGQPPSKKQAIELVAEGEEENLDPRSPARRSARPVNLVRQQLDESFPPRPVNARPNAFDLRLAAARETKKTPSRKDGKTRDAAAANSNLDSIRQWQRHYRKQFPGFVLYFDNISDDQRAKAVRRIQSLGAREEKFFSRAVTHVVTTRAIPPELTTTSPDDDTKQESTQLKTVQPSALVQDQHRTTNLLDAHLQRRQQAHVSTVIAGQEPRRAHGSTADVLTKARELGIKIWALEKLNRILSTILDTATNEEPATQESHRQTICKSHPRQTKDADLEQLLRNEKRMGPSDRDPTVATQDMMTLRGLYLYVHDMDENTKPTLLREYSKPPRREDGKWPQFRLTSSGRCPFIEDPAAAKEAEQATEKKVPLRAVSANAALPAPIMVRRSPRKLSQPTAMAKPLDPPPNLPAKRQSSAEGMPLFGSAQQSLRGLPRIIGGEPVASGVQPSNITSAIRSQVISSAAISSTAAHPNRRLGDSKEVTALKRKVLLEQRGPSGLSNVTGPSAYNDVRGAINAEEQPRAAKRKAQETLGVLQEDEENMDEPQTNQRKSGAKRKKTKPEPKPGYCENCRDKFEDFDEHVQSRKHRKFALTADNWADLDQLLAELRRPRKVS